MARVSIADRGRLIASAARRASAHALGRVATLRALEVFRWLGKGERIAIAPQNLRTADPTRATEIYAGRFALAGKVVLCDGRSPFEMDPPSADWADALLSFQWLRHLRSADSAITRANARTLVEEWISLQGGRHAIAWKPEITAKRILAFLTQAPLILDDADVKFYRRFLRNLARQVRWLRWTADVAQDGLPRLQAHMALTAAALCMTGQTRHLRRAARRLGAELDRQILPDGGHASRNPAVLVEVLADLLPLAQTFTARNVPPPEAVLRAIDRMMPMLRFFRHADDRFALFNGMGPTSQDLLATILAYDDARGAPVANASHSGYQRIEAGRTVVLMDTGKPPPLTLSAEAHAGCLAFELSSRQQRIVVNCGMPETGRAEWRPLARATAAHSTATIERTSSCDFADGATVRRLFGTLVAGGPGRVTVAREADAHAIQVRAEHDGYAARFGIVHRRGLALAADGTRLEGEDLFLPARGDELPAGAADTFAVRFHLHPSVRVTLAHDGHSARLTLPNEDVWSFRTYEDVIAVEESVYLGGRDGPRRTTQLVVHGQARAVPRIEWTFALEAGHLAVADAGATAHDRDPLRNRGS